MAEKRLRKTVHTSASRFVSSKRISPTTRTRMSNSRQSYNFSILGSL